MSTAERRNEWLLKAQSEHPFLLGALLVPLLSLNSQICYPSLCLFLPHPKGTCLMTPVGPSSDYSLCLHHCTTGLLGAELVLSPCLCLFPSLPSFPAHPTPSSPAYEIQITQYSLL